MAPSELLFLLAASFAVAGTADGVTATSDRQTDCYAELLTKNKSKNRANMFDPLRTNSCGV
jgi:hypothetical protein